jgi:hypothetical protein
MKNKNAEKLLRIANSYADYHGSSFVIFADKEDEIRVNYFVPADQQNLFLDDQEAYMNAKLTILLAVLGVIGG